MYFDILDCSLMRGSIKDVFDTPLCMFKDPIYDSG